MKNLFRIPIAHRGLHSENIPENSLPAFSAAAEAGYAIETDVRLTKDGKLVLFHDDSLFRMTGKFGEPENLRFAELSALDLKGGEKIPLLSDLLSLVGGRVPILVEIKNSPRPSKELLPALAQILDGYSGEYAVQSFQPLYVRGYKRLRPQVLCGLLTSSMPDKKDFSPPLPALKRHIVSHMSLNAWVKPDFLSFDFVSPTSKAKRFPGQKLCWTVRNSEEERLAREFAQNIIFEGYLPELK